MTRRNLLALAVLALVAGSCAGMSDDTSRTRLAAASDTTSHPRIEYAIFDINPARLAVSLQPGSDPRTRSCSRGWTKESRTASPSSGTTPRRAAVRRPRSTAWRASSRTSAPSTSDHDGRREVYYRDGSSAGSTETSTLSLFSPSTAQVVSLTRETITDKMPPQVSESHSENFASPLLGKQVAYLESIDREREERAAAFFSSREEDPQFAFAVWARDNASLTDGVIQSRHYSGLPRIGSSVNTQLEMKGVQYTAYFKGGVTAYDSTRNEHWVVFVPTDTDHWPTTLTAVGTSLVIGTEGEGLAIVRVGTPMMLRRVRLDDADEVNDVEFKHDSLTVNGNRRVALPAFAIAG